MPGIGRAPVSEAPWKWGRPVIGGENRRDFAGRELRSWLKGTVNSDVPRHQKCSIAATKVKTASMDDKTAPMDNKTAPMDDKTGTMFSSSSFWAPAAHVVEGLGQYNIRVPSYMQPPPKNWGEAFLRFAGVGEAFLLDDDFAAVFQIDSFCGARDLAALQVEELAGGLTAASWPWRHCPSG